VAPGWPGLEEMVMRMFGYGTAWPAWEIALMWVGMLAFVAFLIWAAYALITSTTRGPGSDSGTADARSILDQRLARGEIDAAEYRRLGALMRDEQGPRSERRSG
jgi:putative membrane protein